MLPFVVPRLATDSEVRVFPGVWNFSLFKTPFPRWTSIPTSFVSFFVFYIFSYLLLTTMGCFSGCLMSSAGIQKLFCGIYSMFKCSFDEFVGEKVVSPSYSSAILGPPLSTTPDMVSEDTSLLKWHLTILAVVSVSFNEMWPILLALFVVSGSVNHFLLCCSRHIVCTISTLLVFVLPFLFLLH